MLALGNASTAVLIGAVILLVLLLILFQVVVVKEYESAVVLRLGKYHATKKAGPRILLRGIDQASTVTLRDRKINLSPLDVVTKNNIPLKIQASIGYHVVDPAQAFIKVGRAANIDAQVKDLSETEIKHLIGQTELSDILADREAAIGAVLNRANTVAEDRWGTKLFRVSIEQIEYPESISGPMASNAIAEQEGQASLTRARYAREAASITAEAARVLDEAGASAMLLTYLQNLIEIAGSDSNTIIMPAGLGKDASDLVAAGIAGTSASGPARRRRTSGGGKNE